MCSYCTLSSSGVGLTPLGGGTRLWLPEQVFWLPYIYTFSSWLILMLQFLPYLLGLLTYSDMNKSLLTSLDPSKHLLCLRVRCFLNVESSAYLLDCSGSRQLLMPPRVKGSMQTLEVIQPTRGSVCISMVGTRRRLLFKLISNEVE